MLVLEIWSRNVCFSLGTSPWGVDEQHVILPVVDYVFHKALSWKHLIILIVDHCSCRGLLSSHGTKTRIKLAEGKYKYDDHRLRLLGWGRGGEY